MDDNKKLKVKNQEHSRGAIMKLLINRLQSECVFTYCNQSKPSSPVCFALVNVMQYFKQ